MQSAGEYYLLNILISYRQILVLEVTKDKKCYQYFERTRMNTVKDLIFKCLKKKKKKDLIKKVF